jgi:hypothetical protein
MSLPLAGCWEIQGAFDEEYRSVYQGSNRRPILGEAQEQGALTLRLGPQAEQGLPPEPRAYASKFPHFIGTEKDFFEKSGIESGLIAFPGHALLAGMAFE